LLLETGVNLAAGENLQVELPGTSATSTRVVWTDGLLAGCEFVRPVSTAVVSAVQLITPVDHFSRDPQASNLISPTNPELGPEEASIRAVLIFAASLALSALLIFLAAIFTLL
jgi:hypothetical protein